MRRNISANIVSIGSMRIARRYKGGKAAAAGGEGGGRCRSRVVVGRTLPYLSENDNRARGESPSSVIHRDLIIREERNTCDSLGRCIFFPLPIIIYCVNDCAIVLCVSALPSICRKK